MSEKGIVFRSLINICLCLPYTLDCINEADVVSQHGHDEGLVALKWICGVC